MVTLKKKNQDLSADSGDIQADCVIKAMGIANTHNQTIIGLACRLHVSDYRNYSLKPRIQFIGNVSLCSTII